MTTCITLPKVTVSKADSAGQRKYDLCYCPNVLCDKQRSTGKRRKRDYLYNFALKLCIKSRARYQRVLDIRNMAYIIDLIQLLTLFALNLQVMVYNIKMINSISKLIKCVV